MELLVSLLIVVHLHKNMGFNKVYLPDIETLKEKVKEWGEEYVVGIYKHKKYEAILGSVESVEYLEELDKKVEKQLRENF